MAAIGRWSIRARISVGVGVVAAAVLLLSAAVLSMQLEDAANRSAAQLAVDDLQPYVIDLQRQPDERPDPASAGVLVLVVDPSGAVRRDSMPAQLAAAARGIRTGRGVTTGQGRFQLAASDVATVDGTWRLWAARDITAGAALLNAVRLTALLGAVAGTLVAAVGAWWIAGRALRPVEELRLTAERLQTDDCSELLPPLGDDELGRLAATLNDLLRGLRAGIAHERALTADVAHELRTPLAVLSAQLEAARRQPDPDLDPVAESVRHLTALTDNLLTLARAELPRPGQLRGTSIAELTIELMRSIDRARVIAPRGTLVDLSVEQVRDPRATCLIDPIDFGRILDNLLGNALQHGAPVSLVIASLALQDGQLLVRVEDDGIGFPPDLAGRAFDRFTRGDRARASGKHGAGLGLALVHQLARTAGGDVRLHERATAGTVVEVLLPATPPQKVEEMNDETASFEHSKAAGASLRRAGLRVSESREATP